jgi:hypothetical protein
MQHIELSDLSQKELAELKFCVESLDIYSPDQIKFIYNNLLRDADGLAHYYIFNNDGTTSLLTLYTY